MDLVILAGGMGSRFGGLKQIQPIDNSGNFIIDYSVFDAIRAGFSKVIFVIKKENLQEFKKTIGKRLEKIIKVEYAFQEIDSFMPKGKNYDISNRKKPWGTAHAILCCKNYVTGNFAIINADDFYGANSYKQMHDFLKNNKDSNTFGMVGFKVINTLTENGEVKRGICNIKNGNLKGLVESSIKQENNKVVAKPVESGGAFEEIDNNTLVSMNLFGFTTKLFDYLEQGFHNFLEDNKLNLSTCEYFIPTILSECINKNLINLKVLSTNEKWYGLTYKEDFSTVCEGIKKLKENNIYPSLLWN